LEQPAPLLLLRFLPRLLLPLFLASWWPRVRLVTGACHWRTGALGARKEAERENLGSSSLLVKPRILVPVAIECASEMTPRMQGLSPLP
jgi:hypothetical protein